MSSDAISSSGLPSKDQPSFNPSNPTNGFDPGHQANTSVSSSHHGANGSVAAAPAAPAPASTKKRSRYTSVACNECKRRKIKCNGERPCERCGNQNLECVYESPNFQDSEDYRRMCGEIEGLKGQVETLFGLVRELKAELERWGIGPGGGGPAAMGLGMGMGLGTDARVDGAAVFDGMGIENGIGVSGGQLQSGGSSVAATAGERHTSITNSNSRGVSVDIGPSIGSPNISASAGSTNMAMDVDGASRHDGRIEFVHTLDTRSQDVEGMDPVMGIGKTDLVALLGVYTSQFQSIYPFLDLPDILWRTSKITTLQEQLLAEKNGSSNGSHHTTPDRRRDLLQERTEVLNDIGALTVKMVLAIAAHSQDPGSNLALRLYMNVHEITANQGVPPGWSSEQKVGFGGGMTVNCNAVTPYAAMVRGMRLRLLHALWQFQHGDGEGASAGAHDIVLVHKTLATRISSDASTNSETAELCLKLGGAIYAMYWRWAMLVRDAPRFDTRVERVPPKRFEEGDDFDRDEEAPLRGPLFEFAKLCSVTAFAFERPAHELAALTATKPPWSKDNAIDHVHRWQGGFSGGLKSLACMRPGFIQKKPAEERTALAVVFLHAHALRLTICRYKRSGAIDRYNGPISELYSSAKFAHESISVLWNLHETGKTWGVHSYLYNNFLLSAGAWIWDLVQDGAIRPSEEVKISLQKVLILLEAYARYWEKAQQLLEKLQDSRHCGILV